MRAKRIVSVIAIICFMLFGGICLTACSGKKSKVTILFDSNGGSRCADVEYVKNGALNMPADPTREGYLFGGWFEDDGVWEQEFDKDNANSYVSKKSKNITLYAKWLKKVILVFVDTMEQKIEDIYLDSLDIELPTLDNAGLGEDYVFAGWYVDKNFEKPYTTTTIVEPNQYNEVFLYPKWEYTKPKSIYYVVDGVDLKKTNDEVLPGTRVTLYQPSYDFYQFSGWFYDSELTLPAPDRMSYDAINPGGIVLYGEFVKKEIDSVSVVGQMKTLYEYGEDIDLGNAKILVKFKDSKFENQIVDITPDMIHNFETTDVGQMPIYLLTSQSKPDGYDFVGAVYFSLNVENIFNNDGPLTSHTNKTYLTENIYYFIKSDIKTLSLMQVGALEFNFGDSTYLSQRDLSVYWTKANGESGSEKLLDSSTKYPSGLNYFVRNLNTYHLGLDVFTLRYHFKTIDVSYIVEPTHIESGYVDSTRSAILLNSQKSLLDNDLGVCLRTDDGRDILYTGLSQEDILEDIDTSVSGEHTAKIKFGSQEIGLTYYVVDLDQISSAEIKEEYYTSSPFSSTFTFTLTMQNGEEVDFICELTYYLDGRKPDIYRIGEINCSSPGTKYLKISFYGREIDVRYVVLES